MARDKDVSEVAFYYPGHIWRSPNWIKTLLLFFDGVGILIPEYKRDEPEMIDPELAGPLRDKGLLHYLVADKVVGKTETERLAVALDQLMTSGALDHLRDEDTAFHEISMSRMGYYGDSKIAKRLYAALKKRGLARPTEDGVSIPLHPMVRYLILVLLAQILRQQGPELGLDLSPATDQPRIMRALAEFLNLPAVPSAGNVVAFDLQTVSVDLEKVPLDEVLSFKAEHDREHRAYARSIKRFARELSLMAPDERESAFDDRQSKLDDLASDLKRRSRRAWRKPASFGLGLSGAAWTYTTGDPFAALLGAGAMLVGGRDAPRNEAGAFSYLFDARERYDY